jgi:dolichyl-phosphate-mannose-protein mannosyltransferase
LAQYFVPVSIDGDAQTNAAVATSQAEQQPQEKVVNQAEEAGVTPNPEGQNVVGKVETVEYRDQDGNILNEEQVASLAKAGSVSFQTRYETRTKLVDAQGHELHEGGHAPRHPDAEGQNPETFGKRGDDLPVDKPASVVGDEKSIQRGQGKPKPASEGNDAT